MFKIKKVGHFRCIELYKDTSFSANVADMDLNGIIPWRDLSVQINYQMCEGSVV